MRKSRIYPWGYLEKLGDYFTVDEDFHQFNYVKFNVVIPRNRYYRGRLEFEARKIAQGSMVVLTNISGNTHPIKFRHVATVHRDGNTFP